MSNIATDGFGTMFGPIQAGGGGGGTIGGTVGTNEVAYGTAPDTIGGDPNLTYDGTNFTVATGGSVVDIGQGFVTGGPNLTVETQLGGTLTLGNGNNIDLVAAQEVRINGAPGAAGEVLTSNGAGLPPTWQAGGGGGVWTQTGAVLSPTTPGDTVEVPGTFGTSAISTSEPSGFATLMSPGALTITDGFALSIDVEAAAARLALKGDSGSAVTPTIRARDFDDSATTLELTVGGLTLNGGAGAVGEVLTSNGPGLAPTWQAGGGGGGTTGSVTTTDATPTALVTLTPGASTTTVYEATVAARKQGSTDAASYKIAATFVESAGVVTQVGTTNVVWSHESDPALDADFVVSGTNVELQVTGQTPVGPVVIDPVTPPAPSGSTWTVGTLGGEDFADLATALASGSVVNGDRLLLSAETFTSGAITVSKQVTIEGAGLGSTVLQTTADGAAPVVFITVSTSNVTIRDMTIKQRKTTNTSIEAAVSITAGTGSSGHYLEAVRVEGMEFCVLVRSDGWQINNCQLAYVGPNNATRRLIGIYRSDGQGLFTNSTYDSGQDGVITGSTRVVAITTTTSPPDEVLGGYLRIGNVTPSNAYPVHQFFNCDYFGIGATPLTLVVDGCTAAETSLFVGFVLPSTQPPLTRCASITLDGNTLTNSHGKGALAIAAVSGGPVSPGTTTYYASANTLGATAFAVGWATGIDPSGVPATDALLGVQTANWSDPNQALSTPVSADWDWTTTVTTQAAP